MENKECKHHFILDQFGATCEKCELYIDSDDIAIRCDYFDFYKEGFKQGLKDTIKWKHVAEMLYKEYATLLEKTNLVYWENSYENSPAMILYKNISEGNNIISLKYDENNDPEILNSDIQQFFDLVQGSLKLAIEALRDILIWAKDLEEAKGIAKFILSRLENQYRFIGEYYENTKRNQ
jgi:hypothetical protein